jgi:hypothetical protein
VKCLHACNRHRQWLYQHRATKRAIARL